MDGMLEEGDTHPLLERNQQIELELTERRNAEEEHLNKNPRPRSTGRCSRSRSRWRSRRGFLLEEREPLPEQAGVPAGARGLLPAQDGTDGVWEQLARQAALAKKRYDSIKTFKKVAETSPVGILLKERLLPLHDIGSDLLVTFGKASYSETRFGPAVNLLVLLVTSLCSSEGLFWDTRNIWWARLSVSFIVMPYVLLWILAGPVVVRAGLARFGRGALPGCAMCVAWLLLGPFFVVTLDVFMIVRFPLWQPRSSWLVNCMRLRVFLETMVESPLQLGLQLRILWVKFFYWHKNIGSPWTLLYSIFMSTLSFCLTLWEIYETKTEQKISFLTCLGDMLCVGLGWRAPLLHVLKKTTWVEYDGEGPLTEDHCGQIARASRASAVLKHVEFTEDNRLSASGKAALLGTFCGPVKSITSMAVGKRGRFGEAAVFLDFSGDDLEDEFLEKKLLLPSTAQSVHLDLSSNGKFTDWGLERLAEHLPSAAEEVYLNLGGNDKFTDRGLEKLAERLPRDAKKVHLGFSGNDNFTDQGLERLVEHFPCAAESISLELGDNSSFATRSLATLLQRLPSGTQSVHLVVGANCRLSDISERSVAHLDFSDDESLGDEFLEKLALHLPSTAQTVHLSLGDNSEFTPRSLATLLRRLPRASQSLHLVAGPNCRITASGAHLDFSGDDSLGDEFLEELMLRLPITGQSVQLKFSENKKITDRGLERLAERLPSAAQRIHLNFHCNGNFTDQGLERLAERLPSTAEEVHLDFHYGWELTDRGLERLAERLPSTAQSVYLEFSSGQFTDRGLEHLAEHLPSAAQSVQLNFSDNTQFTDQGLQRLAARLPSAAQRVDLNFYWNRNFSDLASRELRGRLPRGSVLMAKGRSW